MPKTISVHQLEDLAKGDCKNEILLDTNIDTQIHIISKETETILSFPYGNKFDFVNGKIIIYKK